MPEYFNHNPFSVYLPGPDGRLIEMKSRQKRILPEFFDRYKTRGLIRLAKEDNSNAGKKYVPPKINKQPKTTSRSLVNVVKKNNLNYKNSKQERTKLNKKFKVVNKSNVVGRTINGDANKLLNEELSREIVYPISNNIGVGILSYNRASSLRRCIGSIIKHTDLSKTTVFISDDGSTDQDTLTLLDQLSLNPNIVVLKNSENLGVGGNSNRIMRCLARFKYGILLNDDVEILNEGWEYFYPTMLMRTKFNHFIYRQQGVYGAELGRQTQIGEHILLKTEEKPHGAVLAFTSETLNKIGYYNEAYGEYGMEHIDWSMRVYENNLQPAGFFDVPGSDKYFHIHAEPSSTINKSEKLRYAKEVFKQRSTEYIFPSTKSNVDSITYVIPYRNIGRNDAVKTVINNIRSQRMAGIEIVLVEQDDQSQFSDFDNTPVIYSLLRANKNLFNKSMAFNYGVSISKNEKIILHDADMLVEGNYTKRIFDVLNNYDACHIGKTVIYADKPSSQLICDTGSIRADSINCDRIVGYYEGGSLACTKEAYIRCGGFNEDFWGYGCEDCDFYKRISSISKWFGERSINMLHLWHDRAEGWDKHHQINKSIESQLSTKSIQHRIVLQQTQLRAKGYIQ